MDSKEAATGARNGRGILLLGCVAIFAGVAGCTQESEFRIAGHIEAFVETGDAVLVGATSVPGEDRVLATAPIEQGRFELLGETPAARQVKVKIQVGGETRTATQVIVEPGSDLRVLWGGWVAGLATEGGGPYHRQLVLSWRDSDAYLATLARYAETMTQKRDTPEGPEHATLLGEANRLYGELHALKTGAVDALARHHDPLTALLAIELGGLAGAPDVLDRLDELAPQLAGSPAMRQLAHVRNRIEAYRELADNNAALVPGAIAPDFAAQSASGESMPLSAVWAANKLVLLDFWASWCGPCIKQFPHLKELRARYRDQGFEVVGVSLDTDVEDWREASVEHGLPWVDLGDPRAFSSPAAIGFGVTHLPKSYLLDRSRRVLAKDLGPDLLARELSERLAPAIDGRSRG